MSTRKVLSLVCLLTVCFGTFSSAQQRESPAAAERSYALQARLAAIEADRAGFMNQLLSDWSIYLDNSKYDLQSELHGLIEAAPAWQLYGASLAGDFQTMIDVLRGIRPAGSLINRLQIPEQKSSLNTAGYATSRVLRPGPGTSSIGDTTDQLVYTPIAPCRVVDTRNSGARTGLMAAGTARTFDLTTDGLFEGQGGVTSCPGLPSFSHLGWAVNITVTGYSGFGWLTVWASGGTEPTASAINYYPSLPAVANGINLTGCYACADDITIRAAAAATHVIIDVVGYYSQATIAASSITQVAGTPVTVTAGNAAFVTGGACPTGTILVGGEVDHGGIDFTIGETREATATTWTMWMVNNDAVSRSATVSSRCIDQPVYVF